MLALHMDRKALQFEPFSALADAAARQEGHAGLLHGLLAEVSQRLLRRTQVPHSRHGVRMLLPQLPPAARQHLLEELCRLDKQTAKAILLLFAHLDVLLYCTLNTSYSIMYCILYIV